MNANPIVSFLTMVLNFGAAGGSGGDVFCPDVPQIMPQRSRGFVSANAGPNDGRRGLLLEEAAGVSVAGAFAPFGQRRDRVAEKLREFTRPESSKAFSYVGSRILRGVTDLTAEPAMRGD